MVVTMTDTDLPTKTAVASDDPSSGSSGSGGLSVGGIVGIVIAGLILVGVLVILIVFAKAGHERSDYDDDRHGTAYVIEGHIPGLDTADVPSMTGDIGDAGDDIITPFGDESDSGLLD
jgi:hypothetical protein